MSEKQKMNATINRSKAGKKTKERNSVILRYLTTAGYITTLTVILLFMGASLTTQLLAL